MKLSNNPMFSLIVPVYNLEEYIADCLESILAQTYPDFEVIVINDGSVDKSKRLLMNFAIKIIVLFL
jgi:glycosyltransferase involved in cell wall biosynthesis